MWCDIYWCERISITQDFHKDLNFKAKYNCKSHKRPREVKCNEHFYICLTKLAWTFFFILFLKTVKEEHFISPGNRFHNLAPKFETLSIPYCVVRMFFSAKWLALLKFLSWFPKEDHFLLWRYTNADLKI